MGGTIRVRVRDGRLEPLEKVDLPEGKEITITILDAEALIRNIYANRLISTRPEPRL